MHVKDNTLLCRCNNFERYGCARYKEVSTGVELETANIAKLDKELVDTTKPDVSILDEAEIEDVA